MPVKTEPMTGDSGVLRRYLDEGIVTKLLSTHSCCSGGNPRIWCSRSDDGGIAVLFLSWKHRLWSSTGSQRQEVERLRLSQSFDGYVKSCLTDRCYALSCLVGRCYTRQIFQRLQAVSVGGTWQHGAEVYQWRPRRPQMFARREEVPLGAVVASTIAGPSKVDALVQF